MPIIKYKGYFCMTKLKKALSLTDIHWGAKNNSELHNQDCDNFINWVCELVRNDPTIDHIVFIGDWHENRTALNLTTLNYSLNGASKLNDLNVPVFFVIGNHDLYHRHTRAIHSVPHFANFKNFRIINEITQISDTIVPCLMSPYLFPEEYEQLNQYATTNPIWWGHFEFKDFVITGYNIKMPNGPEADDFKAKRIFSGHFHKRQQTRHVTYIGNCFSTSFGDEGDTDRGVAIYDYATDDLSFINWPKCPLYLRIPLSSVVDNDTLTIPEQTRVKCVVDIAINYEDSVKLKQTLEKKFKLREFSFEETGESVSSISDDADVIPLENQLATINELVVLLLGTITSEKINKNKLIEIWLKLKSEYQPGMVLEE